MTGLLDTVLAALTLAGFAASAQAEEPRLRLEVLRNGVFAKQPARLLDAQGAVPLPWWRTTRGEAQLDADGRLLLQPGERAEQPMALDPQLAATLTLRGHVRGRGWLVVRDGAEGEVRCEVEGDFVLHGAELSARLGRPLVPRLLVRLESREGTTSWGPMQATAEFPCPTASALRSEVERELVRILREWEAHALDVHGPKRTHFVSRVFDIDTATEVQRLPACAPYIPLWSTLREVALRANDVALRELYDAWWRDYVELGFAPETGLPTVWDPLRDEPLLDQPVEIGLPLGFLVDVASKGPPEHRQVALTQAVRIADTVLEHGLLPDGSMAASYVPRNGRPNLDTALLRRLDVPAQLARLSALTGNQRYLRAAHEALATLEYTHHWAGSWQSIDPAFDDEYGHYGARAALVARDVPKDALFKRFALEGWAHFEPLWAGAVSLGGNLAADQVRCWQLLADLALVEPAVLPRAQPLLLDAAYAHMQGEQYGNGAWGDVTIYHYDPRTALQVGDLPGTPSNLLQGLATLAAPHLQLPADEVRARYTSVLRSTQAQYRRAYGYLVDRAPRAGANTAAGSLRVLLGLERMYVALSAPAPR
ncbi:MAG: hypothetical protein RIT40_323 [Planctomycetota bacterium]